MMLTPNDSKRNKCKSHCLKCGFMQFLLHSSQTVNKMLCVLCTVSDISVVCLGIFVSPKTMDALTLIGFKTLRQQIFNCYFAVVVVVTCMLSLNMCLIDKVNRTPLYWLQSLICKFIFRFLCICT